MPRIAHLSDVHILDPHTHRSAARYRVTTRAVSLGRAIDPRSRAEKLSRGLAAATRSGASHVVISGDLTELGDANEFEHFASLLDDAHLPEGSVTLVPGNHDKYTSEVAWRRALAGPLRRWASASATDPGKIVDRGDVAFMPIDTSCFQSIARSGGRFSREAARSIARRLEDPGLANKAIVLVTHHPPFMHDKSYLWQWIDGLWGYAHMLDLLVRHPRVQLLHGHLHKVVDRIVHLGKGAFGRSGTRNIGMTDARARIFGAPAIVDDDAESPRVRLYDLRDGLLESAGFFIA